MAAGTWTRAWLGRIGLAGRYQCFGKVLLTSILVILVLFCPSLAGVASAGENRWTTNGPQRNILALAIDPATPATLYAGSDCCFIGDPAPGGVFKSANAGGSWTAMGLPSSRVLALAIDPSAPATLYAGAFGVFKSTDGGESWTTLNTEMGAAVSVLAIDPTAPATLYAGTPVGVFKSTNAGGSWRAINTGLPETAPYMLISSLAIDPSAPATLYLGTGYGVFKSTDGGGSWTVMNAGLPASGVTALAIDPSAPATLYAGTLGGVFKSTNAGGNWTAVNAGLTELYVSAVAIAPSAPATLFTGTVNGFLFKSANAGESWTDMSTGLKGVGTVGGQIQALAIDPLAPARLYAGTSYGVFDYEATGTCAPGPTTLCLNGGRFRVQVAWSAPDRGISGHGTPMPLTGDTGYFWFFNDANVELVIKVLDARPVGDDHFWVFYGALSNVQYTITVTDTQTGAVKKYENPYHNLASVADTSAFSTETSGPEPERVNPEAQPTAEIENRPATELHALYGVLTHMKTSRPLAVPCTAGGPTLCLNDKRFQVTVDWEVPSRGRSGHGTAVPITDDTGYFWFFGDANVELVIKVLDGRGINEHFWVFYGALSDVQYTTTVTDTLTNTVRTYTNPYHTLASVADTSAF